MSQVKVRNKHTGQERMMGEIQLNLLKQDGWYKITDDIKKAPEGPKEEPKKAPKRPEVEDNDNINTEVKKAPERPKEEEEEENDIDPNGEKTESDNKEKESKDNEVDETLYSTDFKISEAKKMIDTMTEEQVEAFTADDSRKGILNYINK